MNKQYQLPVFEDMIRSRFEDLYDRKKDLALAPLEVTNEGTMKAETVENYKSGRQKLMVFMAEAVAEHLNLNGTDLNGLGWIRQLEDDVASAFGTAPSTTLMITGAQSQADVRMSVTLEETDEAGLLVEQELIEKAVITGSEQLLRFAHLRAPEGEYVLAPSGGAELRKFPDLTSQQNLFIALLNLAERCIYDDGHQTETELVPNLSAMAPANEQAVLYATFLKKHACYEIKEVSHKGVNKDSFPGLIEAAILGREIADTKHAMVMAMKKKDGNILEVLEQKLEEKESAAKAMRTVFDDAERYVDNVRKTVNIMNANGFTLIIDDQHARQQPVFWLPRHELVELQTYMVKFGFERVTELIEAMEARNFEELSAAAKEVSSYSPTKVCFEGSFNQPAFDKVLFGPKACMPFYKVMQHVTKEIQNELKRSITVCSQGGWNVPDVPEQLTGQAAAPNAGAGVHVGSLAKKVKLNDKRDNLLPLSLPSRIKI